MFLSTFEKQLDGKRRLVVPAEFRALVSGPFDGIFCFPSIEADCIEGGGQALFERYRGVIDELDFGDPVRSALEATVYGGMHRLAFDTAGRITLPDVLVDLFGLGEAVTVVGLGDRFQIWAREAWQARRVSEREMARQGLADYRAQQRLTRTGGGAA